MAHYEVLDLESVYSKTGELLYKRPTENLESKLVSSNSSLYEVLKVL